MSKPKSSRKPLLASEFRKLVTEKLSHQVDQLGWISNRSVRSLYTKAAFENFTDSSIFFLGDQSVLLTLADGFQVFVPRTFCVLCVL